MAFLSETRKGLELSRENENVPGPGSYIGPDILCLNPQYLNSNKRVGNSFMSKTKRDLGPKLNGNPGMVVVISRSWTILVTRTI